MKWRTQDWECTTTGVSSYHLKLYLHTMNKVFREFTLYLSFFRWFKTNKLCNLRFDVVLYIQDAWRLYHGCFTITTSDISSIFQLFWDGLAYWTRCSLHTYLVSHSQFWYLLMKTLICCVSRLVVWFDQITKLLNYLLQLIRHYYTNFTLDQIIFSFQTESWIGFQVEEEKTTYSILMKNNICLAF